jgi:hypothetical protein
MRKFFDKDLHNKYDTPAKNIVNKLFKNTAWRVELSDKNTDVDFKVYKNNELVAYLEVEVKTLWNDAIFPYSDVQWPGRKAKYCNLDKPTIFLMFNKNLSKYLTALDKDLLASDRVMVRNKYVAYGEIFFKVPLEKVLFNNVYKQLMRI